MALDVQLRVPACSSSIGRVGFWACLALRTKDGVGLRARGTNAPVTRASNGSRLDAYTTEHNKQLLITIIATSSLKKTLTLKSVSIRSKLRSMVSFVTRLNQILYLQQGRARIQASVPGIPEQLSNGHTRIHYAVLVMNLNVKRSN